jgi:hypothetical protein
MMTLLNKLIITNKYLRYTPIWCWYRLINHRDYRLDDRHLYQDFWMSINSGLYQDFWMSINSGRYEN